LRWFLAVLDFQLGLVFRTLLKQEHRDGCVLDGFPRTRVQVECRKLLVEKMNVLYREHQSTPLAINFRKPTIHVMVLFVDEKTSVSRQLHQGRQVAEANARIHQEGEGELDFIEHSSLGASSVTAGEIVITIDAADKQLPAMFIRQP